MWLLDPLDRVLVLHVEWHTLANSSTEPGNSTFIFHEYGHSVEIFCEKKLYSCLRGKKTSFILFSVPKSNFKFRF